MPSPSPESRSRPASPSGQPRTALVAWTALVFAATALIVVWLRPVVSSDETPSGGLERASVPVPASPAEAGDREQLEWRAALARERAARLRLEASLRAVEARLAVALDADSAAGAEDLTEGEGDRTSRRGLDEQRLVAAGFSPTDAREFKLAYDELQMEQLYARDRAAREGIDDRAAWSTSLEELAAKEETLAARYGDTAYDWMLYASGRPNQVAVEQVFSGSPADAAGLVEGDIVLRYADERIRNGQDLRQATSTGVAGEWVDVEVLRDGRSELIQLPRGPLGITVDVDSVAPTRASG